MPIENRRLTFFVCVLSAVFVSVGVAVAADPIQLGQYRQLFVDDYMIGSMTGVSQVLNQPEKYGPIVVADKSWEGAGLYGPHVWQENGTWQMNYYGNMSESQKFLERATSTDGIVWEKPAMGLFGYGYPPENNIDPYGPGGIPGRPNAYMYTPWDTDPNKQYRALGGNKGPGIFSADGVNWWQDPNAQMVSGLASDGNLALFYDEVRDRYVAYGKMALYQGNGEYLRSTGVAFSNDFLTWTTMQAVLVPDAIDHALAKTRVAAMSDRVEYLDAPLYQSAQFYSTNAFVYEGMTLGLMQVFDISGWEPGKAKKAGIGGEDGIAQVELVSTRNYEQWDRAGNRAVFLPLGEEAQTWESGWVQAGYPGHAPVIRGDEIWIYYGALQTTHDDPWSRPEHPNHDAAVAEIEARAAAQGMEYSGGAIGLAKLRLDGWVSIDAGPIEGTLTTRSVAFETGKVLVINAQAPEGLVIVEIFDPVTGNAIPGFAKEDSDIFNGDEIRQIVTWNGGQADLSALAGQEVGLRFFLQDAKLYSFTVSDIPEPASLASLVVCGTLLTLLRRPRVGRASPSSYAAAHWVTDVERARGRTARECFVCRKEIPHFRRRRSMST